MTGNVDHLGGVPAEVDAFAGASGDVAESGEDQSGERDEAAVVLIARVVEVDANVGEVMDREGSGDQHRVVRFVDALEADIRTWIAAWNEDRHRRRYWTGGTDAEQVGELRAASGL